jgi:hypothetical protein
LAHQRSGAGGPNAFLPAKAGENNRKKRWDVANGQWEVVAVGKTAIND